MNADAFSDLVLLIACGVSAWWGGAGRAAWRGAMLLLGLAAAMGVLRYSGLAQALGPHRFFSLLAACVAFWLLAASLREARGFVEASLAGIACGQPVQLERLGYFDEVTVDTQEVPGAPDQVDLVVNVVEKPTGSLQLGAGFSSAEKLSFSFAIKQENIFGSGNSLSFGVNTAKSSRSLAVSTVDPYFTDDGVSRAIDVYYRQSKPYNSRGSSYDLATPGMAIRFGVPFSEFDTVFFGVGAEREEQGAADQEPAGQGEGLGSESHGGGAREWVGHQASAGGRTDNMRPDMVATLVGSGAGLFKPFSFDVGMSCPV